VCGRFTLRTPADVLVTHFVLAAAPEVTPRFNIAPTQPAPVVRINGGGSVRECVPLRWGLIPSWAKDAAIGNRLINARCETVADKPAFRTAVRRRRCLVVADGFYEWQKTAGRGKQPYYFHLANEGPLAFAGLWERWMGPRDAPTAEPLESCTIITTAANELVGPVHERMPVIVDPVDYTQWLDPTATDVAELAPLLRSTLSDQLIARPVGQLVNSPKNDDPQCVERQRELF